MALLRAAHLVGAADVMAAEDGEKGGFGSAALQGGRLRQAFLGWDEGKVVEAAWVAFGRRPRGSPAELRTADWASTPSPSMSRDSTTFRIPSSSPSPLCWDHRTMIFGLST